MQGLGQSCAKIKYEVIICIDFWFNLFIFRFIFLDATLGALYVVLVSVSYTVDYSCISYTFCTLRCMVSSCTHRWTWKSWWSTLKFSYFSRYNNSLSIAIWLFRFVRTSGSLVWVNSSSSICMSEISWSRFSTKKLSNGSYQSPIIDVYICSIISFWTLGFWASIAFGSGLVTWLSIWRIGCWVKAILTPTSSTEQWCITITHKTLIFSRSVTFYTCDMSVESA